MRKVAILIDGGFFLNRINSLDREELKNIYGITENPLSPKTIVDLLDILIQAHLNVINQTVKLENQEDLLYRTFYYDAIPYSRIEHYPLSRKAVDFKKSESAIFRNELFQYLKVQPNLALRLGEVRKTQGWQIKSHKKEFIFEKLRNGETISKNDFSDEDFTLDLKQKAVDMRIGVDITSLTLKKLVDTIILVSGDGDFTPAAKLARVEGVRFILDPMGRNIHADLAEHIDNIMNTFFKPNAEGVLSKVNWKNFTVTTKS